MRWLSHPEDAHGLLFCLLHFAAIGSAFWLWLHPAVTGFVTPGLLALALGLPLFPRIVGRDRLDAAPCSRL